MELKTCDCIWSIEFYNAFDKLEWQDLSLINRSASYIIVFMPV